MPIGAKWDVIVWWEERKGYSWKNRFGDIGNGTTMVALHSLVHRWVSALSAPKAVTFHTWRVYVNATRVLRTWSHSSNQPAKKSLCCTHNAYNVGRWHSGEPVSRFEWNTHTHISHTANTKIATKYIDISSKLAAMNKWTQRSILHECRKRIENSKCWKCVDDREDKLRKGGSNSHRFDSV